MLEALDDLHALNGVNESVKPLVTQQLKTLQRIEALIQDPEALPVLLKAGLTLAYRISQMSEEALVNKLKSEIDAATVKNIYAHASQSSIRNDQALISALQTTRGGGLAAIDGRQRLDERVSGAEGGRCDCASGAGQP